MRRLGLLAARLLARVALCAAFGPLGLELLALGLVALGSTLFNLGLGLCNRRQAILTACDLRGYVHAVGCALAIGLLGQRKQRLNLLAQLRLNLVGVRPGQRRVLARVGLDLGAVQRDAAELEKLHLARQHQHLHEQRLHLLEKAPPERGQRVVIGMGVGSHVAECH